MWPALALALCAHSSSEGKSRFDVAADGTVVIEVQLSALDLPELCNVELGVSDAGARALQQERLDTCLRGGVPFWLRVTDAGRAGAPTCPLAMTGWRFLEPRTVPEVIVFNARARCAARVRTLQVDWGLFAGVPLDHTSVAQLLLPNEDPKLFAFSKRARRLTLELAQPLSPLVWAGAAALVVAVVVAGALIGRRRARG